MAECFRQSGDTSKNRYALQVPCRGTALANAFWPVTMHDGSVVSDR